MWINRTEWPMPYIGKFMTSICIRDDITQLVPAAAAGLELSCSIDTK